MPDILRFASHPVKRAPAPRAIKTQGTEASPPVSGRRGTGVGVGVSVGDGRGGGKGVSVGVGVSVTVGVRVGVSVGVGVSVTVGVRVGVSVGVGVSVTVGVRVGVSVGVGVKPARAGLPAATPPTSSQAITIIHPTHPPIPRREPRPSRSMAPPGSLVAFVISIL
jgi:hypothetical protein